MKVSLNKAFIIYLLVFSLVAYVPKYSSILFTVLTIFNAILLTKNKNIGYVVLSITLIGNEMFAIINIILYIFVIVAKDAYHVAVWNGKLKKSVLLPIAFVLGVSLISSVIYATWWNVVFYILYLILLLVTYSYCKVDIEKQDALKIIRNFILIEFIATILLALRTGRVTPGDIFGGSLLNAHFFANWLFLSLFALLVIQKDVPWIKRIKVDGIYIVFIFLMIYLASAITVFVAACVACVLYVALYPLNRRKGPDLLILILGTYAAIFFVMGILYLEPVKAYLSSMSHFLDLYLYSSGWNYKLEYFYGTLFRELKGIRLFTGFGLGQYGSRFANLFAYDVMWRGDNVINKLVSSLFESHYLPQYAKYISFYDEQFVSLITWRSAVMSYPFSSFIALIAETGLIGVTFVAYLINKTFGSSPGKILIYYFLIVCIFDIFFDDYLCVLTLLVYLALIKSIIQRKE